MRFSRRDIQLMPDAELTFRTVDKGRVNHWRFAVEVELTRKSHQRVVEKLWKYLNRPEIAVVVWVCGKESIQAHIQRNVGKLDDKKFMFVFVLYSDLLKNGLGDACLTDWQGVERDIFHLEPVVEERAGPTSPSQPSLQSAEDRSRASGPTTLPNFGDGRSPAALLTALAANAEGDRPADAVGELAKPLEQSLRTVTPQGGKSRPLP